MNTSRHFPSIVYTPRVRTIRRKYGTGEVYEHRNVQRLASSKQYGTTKTSHDIWTLLYKGSTLCLVFSRVCSVRYVPRYTAGISAGIYPTERFGTLGTGFHTIPKISVRSVQPSIPYRKSRYSKKKYREFGRGTGTTPIPYRKSRYARYRPSYPTENFGTLGTALIPYRKSRYSTRKYREFGRGIGTTPYLTERNTNSGAMCCTPTIPQTHNTAAAPSYRTSPSTLGYTIPSTHEQ